MIYAIPYDALLGFHLVAVAIFLAGLLLVAVSLPGVTRPPVGDGQRREAARLRTINDFAATPALILLWLCGLGMAVQAGWYAMEWMRLKAAIVLLLSVLHIHQSRQLRRVAMGRPVRPSRYRILALVAVAVLAIGILVIAKPF